MTINCIGILSVSSSLTNGFAIVKNVGLNTIRLAKNPMYSGAIILDNQQCPFKQPMYELKERGDMGD